VTRMRMRIAMRRVRRMTRVTRVRRAVGGQKMRGMRSRKMGRAVGMVAGEAEPRLRGSGRAAVPQERQRQQQKQQKQQLRVCSSCLWLLESLDDAGVGGGGVAGRFWLLPAPADAASSSGEGLADEELA
jgi:hypothetical protein